MDQSFSDSDITMSPSQILERLQMLRQLQLLQRSKLQKQMNFQDSPEITKSITEIVSHFSDSTSYNTFRSLLQSSQENVNEQSDDTSKSHRENLRNVMDGVTPLNLSQESEYINDSPSSTMSALQNKLKSLNDAENNVKRFVGGTAVATNHISLDDMPILSPKKDFEALLLEKLRKEEKSSGCIASNTCTVSKSKTCEVNKNSKKPYLKRGEGMARFGIKKQNLVIQNTKALPWKKNDIKHNKDLKVTKLKESNQKEKLVTEKNNDQEQESKIESIKTIKVDVHQPKTKPTSNEQIQECTNDCTKGPSKVIEPRPHISSTKKQTSLITKEKTWASVLSKEQNDLLTSLKQSDYYKNFLSPSKSIISDISCDDNIHKLRQEKEVAEQNLFELLENKVNHDSFSIENSFFNRFLGKAVLESSGESTPLVLKKCISNNPKLMNIAPSTSAEHRHLSTNSETCECEECSDTCSSVSCCCSCKTMTENNLSLQVTHGKDSTIKNKPDNNNDKVSAQNECHNDAIVNNEVSANMAEMNAKLIATSELLKERLKELEDEIETFRKENLNLNKMREAIEIERQTFFQEKQEYEKKFNEDKILSEYYIAEEKEKLQKQKQIYEKHVRDIRGRLNKKEKDEVVSLKKEIQDLKEEIRIKDAKSTSALARLRNQIKIMEKEKKNYVEEVEKLKKENRRIQHSNDITRRLTNIKYLEQINKKLNNMATKDSHTDIVLDPDTKYKAHAIERQSRPKTVHPLTKNSMRPRARSVPNLKVTSRYAKYFSQKDSLSDMEKYKVINDHDYDSNNDSDILEDFDQKDKINSRNSSTCDEDNNLEKIYNERFRASLPSQKTHVPSTPDTADGLKEEQVTNYFINKGEYNEHLKRLPRSSLTESTHQQKSPSISNSSKSSTFCPNYSSSSGISTNISGNISYSNDNKSYTDIRSNRKLNSFPTFSNQSSIVDQGTKFNNRMTPSPEPTTSKTSLTKTNLNPTEIINPDGTKELRFPNGNVKIVSADGKYSKFIYYNGDIKENFYNEGRIKYYYSENKTVHTTHADGLEVLEFPDGQTEKRYKDGSSEIRLPNGSIRYFDPKNEYVREEWRFPDGTTLIVSANGEQRIVFPNGQVEVHTKDHKRREFPDGTVKLIYNDGTSETRYSSGRVRIKDKHGNLIMDSAPG